MTLMHCPLCLALAALSLLRAAAQLSLLALRLTPQSRAQPCRPARESVLRAARGADSWPQSGKAMTYPVRSILPTIRSFAKPARWRALALALAGSATLGPLPCPLPCFPSRLRMAAPA